MKRAFLISLLFSLVCLPASAARASVSPTDHARAEELHQQALVWMARNTVDARREARRALEQATLLEPDNVAYRLALARVCYASGFLRVARQNFERATRIQPSDASGHAGLGLVWRRDWLKYLDRRSLDRAVEEFSSAVRLDSTATEAWLTLVPLLLEQGRPEAAMAGARSAIRSDPGRLEAYLALANCLYREGSLAEAESLFVRVIPQLRRGVRERYEDIGPVATKRDTAILNQLPAEERPAFVAGFWKDNDPDLTTPQNEARLEYWSRVTQAYFLFFEAKRGIWDERGEMYVRFGPPTEMQYNPLGAHLGGSFPANVLVWNYPEIGLRVALYDRLLSEFYLPPVTRTREWDPMPDPDSLASHGDAMAARSGRGVFPLLPPGSRPLPLEGLVARFEAPGGPRLLAQLEAPGGPADSLWAEWVVLDSLRAEWARSSRTFSPSACAATTRRVADFTADIPPGRYIVSLSARHADGRRGVMRAPIRLGVAGAALDLSDVVVACGTPDMSAGSSVRIEPNPAARVRAPGPVSAYFEIYNLTPGDDGLGRFEYVYVVRSLAKDTRFWLQKLLTPSPGPPISVSREESNVGRLRRQFITVPVGSLAPGRYRLEVTVRDLVSDDRVTRGAEFTLTP